MQEFKKHLSSTFFGVILVCFFTPFVEVSCNNIKVASPSGWHFITGDISSSYNNSNPLIKDLADGSIDRRNSNLKETLADYKYRLDREGDRNYSNSIPIKQPNILLIISFISVVIGLSETLFRWNNKSLITIGSLGLMAHVGFYILIKNKINEKLDEIPNIGNQRLLSSFVHFDFSGFYLLTVALFISIICFNLYLIFNEQNYKSKKCFFCAEDIKFEAIICKHCGKEVVTSNLGEQNNILEVESSNQQKKGFDSFGKIYILPIFVIVVLSSVLYRFLIAFNI